LYDKILKNYQISLGIPFKVKIPDKCQQIAWGNEQAQTEDGNAASGEEQNPECIIARAREEAELIIKEAELEAERIIKNAIKKAEQERAAIEERASQKGYEDGIAKAEKMYKDLLQEAEFIREHAKTEYNEILRGMEADIIDMILDISVKVVGAEIRQNRDSIVYLVKQAFEKCANKDNVVLKVSPEDYGFLAENKELLLSEVEGLEEYEIKKDFSLKQGSCIIETSFGAIDGSAHTKLGKIEEAFRQISGGNRG